MDLEEVLQNYYGEDIVSKREEKSLYENERYMFFNELIQQFQCAKAIEWLRSVFLNKNNAYNLLVIEYESNKYNLKRVLEYTEIVLDLLTFNTNDIKRLPILSAQVTKNPHSFDKDQLGGKILIHSICYLLNVRYPENAEEYTEALYGAGVIGDEISNFTICSGIHAYKDNTLHEGWKGFSNKGEPLQINLSNLSVIDKVCIKGKVVFVFENPSVFIEVISKTKEHDASFICSNGQPKLATLILLDKIVSLGYKIYYSGDFDPEGLCIADRLKSRYNENLELWRYSMYEYKNIISQDIIEECRLKKMDKIKDELLINISITIKNTKHPGYQELLIDKYISDVVNIARRT